MIIGIKSNQIQAKPDGCMLTLLMYYKLPKGEKMLKSMINPCLSSRCIGMNLSGKKSSLVLCVFLILLKKMRIVIHSQNKISVAGGEIMKKITLI